MDTERVDCVNQTFIILDLLTRKCKQIKCVCLGELSGPELQKQKRSDEELLVDTIQVCLADYLSSPSFLALLQFQNSVYTRSVREYF